jgi:hypothetical protein
MTAPKLHMYPVNDNPPISKASDVEDNWLTGYVRLYRSLENKAWYKKSEYVHLWIHLFIKATRKDREDWFAGEPITLKPGQFITGRKKLASETGIQESKIERILKCFQTDQQIEQLGSNTSRLISIRNWHLYQNVEQPNEQQMNNGRTTGEQRVNTIQESREYKEVKEGSTPPKNWLYSNKGFFDRQIAKNQGQAMIDEYTELVEFLHGKNRDGLYFENVLSLSKQISYKDFVSLKETAKTSQRTIGQVLVSMENKATLRKDYKNVYLTVNNWLKQEFKK